MLLLDLPPQSNVPPQPIVEMNRQAEFPAIFLSHLFEEVQLLNGTYGGQCAAFVRDLLNLEPKGDAYQWPAPFSYPIIGGWVKFKGNHVAAVIGIVGDSIITVDSNSNGKRTVRVGKTYKFDDPRIIGYGFEGVFTYSKNNHHTNNPS